MASIVMQQSVKTARFIILNLADPTGEWSQLPNTCKELFPHQIELITKNQLSQTLHDLIALSERRAAMSSSTADESIYFFILGLHRTLTK